ncbi:hypothetical protein M6B38_286610 [Iris pallida]|uniref:Uncharacterized protein n=1 Tax=Iris pallida TaxID=29817 RepID=A0AAX6HXA3_IRIPA|nr:hypothetical protein M6B38_286610 [Iris pallida]
MIFPRIKCLPNWLIGSFFFLHLSRSGRSMINSIYLSSSNNTGDRSIGTVEIL